MLSYAEALDIILRAGNEKPLAVESADIGGITGRVCASTVHARVANQPFDNSAMDGFAVRIRDFVAGETALEIAGLIAAGA